MTALEAESTVRAFVDAWNSDDETARNRLLDRSWSSSGVYTDPLVHLEGIEPMREHARGFGRRWPGARIVVTTPIHAHNGMVCFGWRVVGETGEALRDGTDFGELAEDGRLRRVVGFFAT
jgi:hypothetical protein